MWRVVTQSYAQVCVTSITHSISVLILSVRALELASVAILQLNIAKIHSIQTCTQKNLRLYSNIATILFIGGKKKFNNNKREMLTSAIQR